MYVWLCWVFVSVWGLSLVVASGGHSSSRCAGLSLSRPFLLQSTGSRCAGSVVVAHGPSCSAACGIFPDQGSIPCPLHWQADSQPLRHQGSPIYAIIDSVSLYGCLITISNLNSAKQNSISILPTFKFYSSLIKHSWPHLFLFGKYQLYSSGCLGLKTSFSWPLSYSSLHQSTNNLVALSSNTSGMYLPTSLWPKQ